MNEEFIKSRFELLNFSTECLNLITETEQLRRTLSRSLRVHTVEPEFRGQFSRDTLDLLCLQPQHCEGDEYILINGKLWELQVLLNHGWVYCELKKYPRLLIKSGDNEDA